MDAGTTDTYLRAEKIKWWALGGPSRASAVETLGSVLNSFFGRSTKLAIGWDWIEYVNQDQRPYSKPRVPAGITSNEHFRIIPPKTLRGTSTASKLTEAFPNSKAWVGNHWFQRYPLLLVETPVCAKGTSFAQQHRQGSRVEILCSNSGISHHNHAGVICTYTAIFPDLVCDKTTSSRSQPQPHIGPDNTAKRGRDSAQSRSPSGGFLSSSHVSRVSFLPACDVKMKGVPAVSYLAELRRQRWGSRTKIVSRHLHKVAVREAGTIDRPNVGKG